MSALFNAVACTLTKSSFVAGFGVGISFIWSTSTPPYSSSTTAFIKFSYLPVLVRVAHISKLYLMRSGAEFQETQ